MWSAMKRWWRSLGKRLGTEPDKVSDPRAQLEQAIQAAREQHRLLTEQAAIVIANQSQLQYRLDRAIEEYGSATTSARQSLVLADEARRSGEETRAETYDSAARAFATRTIVLDREITDLRTTLLEAARASEQAKEAVRRNAAVLGKTLAERERLLSRLDQAEMQEQMNAAMALLGETVGDDAPSLADLKESIDRRLAMAKAVGELREGMPDMQMLEVEQAEAEAATAARLGDMRRQLGLDDRVATGRPGAEPHAGSEAGPDAGSDAGSEAGPDTGSDAGSQTAPAEGAGVDREAEVSTVPQRRRRQPKS
jgi:phage shock protein A